MEGWGGTEAVAESPISKADGGMRMMVSSDGWVVWSTWIDTDLVWVNLTFWVLKSLTGTRTNPK